MSNTSFRAARWISAVALAGAAIGLAVLLTAPSGGQTQSADKNAPPPATPVSVAVVEQRDVTIWDEFSGRLEAIERVEVRSRVAGAIQTVHFREGALVKQGDLLITIDPAPFRRRSRALAGSGGGRPGARAAHKEGARAQPAAAAVEFRRDFPERAPTSASAPMARLKPLCARLRPRCSRRGSISATREIRAPVAGRVGKLEITVGNLVAAGPGAPVLTTLVSVSPIYASFSADEEVVMRALKALAAEGHAARRSNAFRWR